ncbi:MAG TPA: hypothetical protein VM869_17025 [Enhygromyxa sp.]|nr:hypothetical protein [Enhygromyxa sp.]
MIASDQGSKPAFLEQPTFDEVVFGEGEEQQRYGFHEFRELPLRRRVQLLLSKPPRFFLNGVQISRTDAMRFQG